MARITTAGLEEEMKRMSRLGKNIEPAAKKGVKAGAAVLVAALKDAAPRGKTGKLSESIKALPPKYKVDQGHVSVVLPDGSNAKGVPYAKIGNILEYGWSDGTRHYPWFYSTIDKAMDDAKDAAAAAAYAELHKGV